MAAVSSFESTSRVLHPQTGTAAPANTRSINRPAKPLGKGNGDSIGKGESSTDPNNAPKPAPKKWHEKTWFDKSGGWAPLVMIPGNIICGALAIVSIMYADKSLKVSSESLRISQQSLALTDASYRYVSGHPAPEAPLTEKTAAKQLKKAPARDPFSDVTNSRQPDMIFKPREAPGYQNSNLAMTA